VLWKSLWKNLLKQRPDPRQTDVMCGLHHRGASMRRASGGARGPLQKSQSIL